MAVAELLAEEGRKFHDEKLLKEAITQYEFLRKQYPGSKYRVDALFTIAQIYQEDLKDNAGAQATFEEFLERYPKSQLRDQAQKALADLSAAAAAQLQPKSRLPRLPRRSTPPCRR